VQELLSYVFSPLREGDIALFRGSGNGLAPILLVAAEETSLGSVERLEHEYALKAELDADWAARPVALTHYNDRMTLVLEDPGGAPLDRLLGRPLDVSHFLRIAISLAGALRRVHERGLIHKDVKPANILVDAASGRVWLTGFGIASRLPRERQAPAPPEVIAGTLAYMAPEQTGRMNRSVDSRSDLYALGVTFYEMLTGQLPFTAADPMEWVHCHIARQPAPPNERVAGVPGPLSAIVMKLLAKTAEERYQTAAGVEADLRGCVAEWESHGRIDPFPLGVHDASDRLLMPERLYGREREIDTLLASFDRVVANGTLELVLVSGYSGIGKSSVVNELHKALVPPRGLFASGKFDQYKRDIPYATLGQAFQGLVRSLLSQSETELGRWRDSLSEALGPNGQLIVNLVPELELVIGKQPAVADLPPQDAQNRFQTVFRRFLGAFATSEHPLALFLDDLQWLDAATLDLLEHLVTHSEVRHLLLVGAYRDNEVGPAHPLLRRLQAIRAVGARVHEIVLAPLGLDDVGGLIADALHCEPERAGSLAELVREKTGGNPFFAIQFFIALADEGLLAFDPVTRDWQWNIDRIRAKSYTDNVVDLMAGKLRRFSSTTQEALKQLACLGNVAQIATLALVLGKTEMAMHAALWEAVHAGLVLRQEGTLKFLHDRIQQAAYSLIPDEQRADVHLRIGRVLLASMTEDELAEHLFEVANHFNRGSTLLVDRDEKAQVATIELRAGRKAKASTAYASACVYLVAGMALLDESNWNSHYDLTFSLWLERAECEYLSGQLASAEAQLSLLSTRARTIPDSATVTRVRINLYTNLDHSDSAVEVGLEYLRQINSQWSPHPTEEDVRQEYDRLWQRLGPGSIEALLDLPLMSDPNRCATMDVLTVLTSPALFTDLNLFRLIVGRMAALSLDHGNSDGSCLAYVWLGGILGTYFGDYQTGFRFGRLGLDLVEKRGLDRLSARVYLVFAVHVAHWTQHLRTCRAFLRRAFDAAQHTGDLTYAAYSCADLNTNLLASGDPLGEVELEVEKALEFVEKVRFGLISDLITAQHRLVRTLRGLTPDFNSFNDAEFDESRFEQHLENNPSLAIAASRYWILKLQACVYAGNGASAVAAASKAASLLWTVPTQVELPEYQFYGALGRAARCDTAAAAERPQHLQALASHLKQIAVWANNCPARFANRAALVGAELARLEERELEAERLYEEAIRSARANGFVHNEALANELASRFYAARGFETIADAYLRSARHCYVRWGAFGKVRQLEQLHPHLRDAPVPASATMTIGAPVEGLDVGTVVKASQAVSGEIELGKLIETLLRIAVEHAGAERGLLILFAGDEPRIAAEATTGRGQVELMLRQTAISPTELPESVLHYVVRARKSVILDDALAQNPFSADEYLRQKRVRSVLCLPLVKQAELIGVLYLENNLASHVFTPARISVLEVLASQAAISLENARLYNDLREREARIRRLVDSNIIGIMIWDFQGRIIEANQAFLDMLGYSREDLISDQLRWTELTPAEWRDADERAGATLKAAGTVQPREKEYLRKDGSRVPILLGATTFGDRQDEGVAFVLDLTERKRAELERQRLASLVEQAADLMAIADLEGGTPIYLNKAGLKMVGFDSLEEARTRRGIHYMFPEDREFVNTVLWPTVLEKGSWSGEMRLRHFKTGNPIPIHYSAFRIDDPKTGQPVNVGNVCSDITERKRAEEKLRASEQRLLDAQMELARVTRVTTLGELTASIAHEVNQPLAAVVANAEACLRWLNRATPDLDAVRRSVEWVIDDGNRASEVIRRVRALANKADIEKAPLDINDVVREVITLVQRELFSHRVSVRMVLAPALPMIMGDRVQLQQVIINLVMNGIEAMQSVTDRPRELAIRSREDEPQQVLLSVTDCGVGISAEDADRLFTAFFTTKSSGMGMGLSICRTIMEAHGGRLWATANIPHGATFQFTLPVNADTAS
jgi:PAS domain S-box-containing protein